MSTPDSVPTGGASKWSSRPRKRFGRTAAPLTIWNESPSSGPFRLIRAIGRGGAGSVYPAERTAGEVAQRVAIKLLRSGGDDPASRERFPRERQVLFHAEPSGNRAPD